MSKTIKYVCDSCGKEILERGYDHSTQLSGRYEIEISADLCEKCGKRMYEILKGFYGLKGEKHG